LGTTQVICSATNSCGVFDSCAFDVTVESLTLSVDVELSATMVGGPFDRCITFDLWDCDGPPIAQHVTVSQPLTFFNGFASAVDMPIPGGDWECLTVRDELHTLSSRAADFSSPDGIHYTATVTGAPASGGHWLVSGNLNDDEFVDILDFGVMSPLYLSVASPDTPCGAVGPDANVNGDDRVDLLDLVFIMGNWLVASEPDCCGSGGTADRWAGPIEAISLNELRLMGLGHMAEADLNRDGWLDMNDIRVLRDGADSPPGDGRPPPGLSDKHKGKVGRQRGPRG
jgi:hypothetical protein